MKFIATATDCPNKHANKSSTVHVLPLFPGKCELRAMLDQKGRKKKKKKKKFDRRAEALPVTVIK
jgi:hypothetical protein